MDTYVLSNEFEECLKDDGLYSLWLTRSGDYAICRFKGLTVYKCLFRDSSYDLALFWFNSIVAQSYLDFPDSL